ncbi:MULTISPECIES: hypothetical protein [unclassified Paenibacillus]|uniref:hypothetical protein n=1 Tax=unclassified Paenibacillus TaxID=185978 RepID=UPI0009569293|nr:MULTISPECIES: hypothetical protein [unclassified Paenibacillus]SIR44299.1 hypothetical protein SAMN05880555_3837 [Paenibacillus sp. RU4X]SIR54076.1 hypothetical protein SAMN05880570_3840 [Paenibacillus sp. RU4T]
MMKRLKLAAMLVVAAAFLSACGSKTVHQEGGHGSMNMEPEQNAHGSMNMNMNMGQEHNAHGSSDASAGHAHEGGEGEGAAAEASDVKAEWTLAGGGQPEARRETLIRVAITSGGKPVEQFDTAHEQKQHMIIVSKDLSYFSHIHPEYKGGGVFEIATEFPAGGEYKLIADFVPAGGSAMSRMQGVSIGGAADKAKPIEPDGDLTQVVDGNEIALSIEGLAAGKEAMLTYTIADARTEKPVTDLQPYLGAVGHVVILTADAESYLHVHPMDEKASGPEARFMTTFPKSGIYKIWGQFKRGGEVFTVPFVIKVP